MVLEIQDRSAVPRIAEPWFLAFGASVEIHPVMTAKDLAKAGPFIEQAVKKYSPTGCDFREPAQRKAAWRPWSVTYGRCLRNEAREVSLGQKSIEKTSHPVNPDCPVSGLKQERSHVRRMVDG